MTFFLLMCPALPLVHRQESVGALVLQRARASFGLVGETASPVVIGFDDTSPFMEDGALTGSSAFSTTVSEVFFRRGLGDPRAGASPG